MLIRRIALLLVVSVGASATGIVLLLATAFVARAWWTTPFEVLGFGAAPEQPIAFPHTVHAGIDVWTDSEGNPKLDADGNEMYGLGLDCTFCHRNVDKGATASIPPVEQCLFCHASVQGEELTEVAKLVDAWENKEPVAWERVPQGARPRALCARGPYTLLPGAGRNPGGRACSCGRGRLLHLPRRRGRYGRGQAGAQPEDGRLRRLSPGQQCAYGLHNLSLLG